MKYKGIDSLLHNFGHSFVSLMNYFDDSYIIDLLPEILSKSPTKSLTIKVLQREVEPNLELPAAFLKSLAYYYEWFPKLTESHKIDLQSLSDVTLQLRIKRFGFNCLMECRDDRGAHHKVVIA